MRAKSVQFRVPDDLYEQLHELSKRAKIRGAKNASPNIMARSLMQAALGVPVNVAAANEMMIQAFAFQKRLSNEISALIGDKLPELLEAAELD